MFVFQIQIRDKQKIISAEFVPFIDGLPKGKLAEQNANRAYYSLKEKRPELADELKNFYVKLRQEGKSAEEARIWVRRFLYSETTGDVRQESLFEKYNRLDVKDLSVLYNIARKLENNINYSDKILKSDFSGINFVIRSLKSSLNEDARKTDQKYAAFYSVVKELVPPGFEKKIPLEGSS